MHACLDVASLVGTHSSAPADPFGSDEAFLLSMLTLEELGATGNKVLLPCSDAMRSDVQP